MYRRVVTGHSGGKSVFLADGIPPRTHEFQHMTGMGSSFAWAESDKPSIGGDDGVAETVTDETLLIPALGETRLIILRIPPDSWAMREDFDPAAAGAEFAKHHAEMAAVQEPDSPGMHRTESIDYVVVIEGQVWLELDDQEETLLQPSDIVIQKGARHAWRNKSDEVATLAVVLVGAERTS